LATELIRQAPEGKVVITGGGFISEDQADSNDKSLNLDNLKATHEPDELCCQKECQVFFIFRQRKKTWQIRR
jgi:hypothetical protein